jgi:hypothetical protein
MALRANKPDEDADSGCGAGLRPCGRAFARPGALRIPGERVFNGAAYANLRNLIPAPIAMRRISPKIDSPLVLRAFAGSADILYWTARAA